MNKDNVERKPNIAVVIDCLNAGGVSLALQEFLKNVHSDNIEITLFVKEYNGESQIVIPPNIEIKPWGEYYKFHDFLPLANIREVFPYMLNSTMQLISYRNCYKKNVYNARKRKKLDGEYDCVVAYQMIANDVTVMTLDKAKAKRSVLWLHGQKNILQKDLPFYKRLYSKADSIVCVAKDSELYFQKQFPTLIEKTVTVHNFFDVERIKSMAKMPIEFPKPKDECIIITTVGRLSKEKGIDRIAAVAKHLKNDGFGFVWYIVGDGDERARLNKEICSHDLVENVFTVGYTNNPYPYISNCDIYVQPSYKEGYCTSTMEAKILKKPCVVTKVSGMNEQFVNGENGLIVESSVDGIYHGIKELIEHPELREKIIANLAENPVNNEETLKKTLAVIGALDE